jgi:apolipoprotein D and lipocalin family protein
MFYFIARNTNKREYASGYAFVPNLSKPNHLIVQFPFPSPPAQYNVWKTDYNTYSLVYTCTQLLPEILKFEFIWILSKQQKLDPNVVQDLKALLQKSGVKIDKFEMPDYGSC